MRSSTRVIPMLALTCVGVLAGLGCGKASDAPKTYQVKGKVVVKGADPSVLRGGYVRLQSVADPKVTAVSEIEDDGSFVLGTSFKDRPLGGVPEGEYRVLIEPPPPEDEGSVPRVLIHPRYLRFDTSPLKCSVGPGKDEPLLYELERGR